MTRWLSFVTKWWTGHSRSATGSGQSRSLSFIPRGDDGECYYDYCIRTWDSARIMRTDGENLVVPPERNYAKYGEGDGNRVIKVEPPK